MWEKGGIAIGGFSRGMKEFGRITEQRGLAKWIGRADTLLKESMTRSLDGQDKPVTT